MTWDETIRYIRILPEHSVLVEKAYFDEDLHLNVRRFSESDEFKETLKIFKKYKPNASKVLDVGCGNGISAINFALKGYNVSAVEPDKSDTVGAGAIKLLKEELNLENIEIFEDFAENINFPNNFFDVVYVRQAMHHANNLDKFIKECVRVLKPSGLLLTIRDHVIYNEKDKEWFLSSHPLQKYYGGENAFTSIEYKNAFKKAGAKIIKELKYFDSIINYFPATTKEVLILKNSNELRQKKKLINKLGSIANNWLVWNLYCLLSSYKPLNETTIPGRIYSYIVIKK
ncbi:MAG: methyltransferase domain-containing protein [Flaviramulus sp.]|nr:methyltransferase domain-containing protein [Flaviramulus sp.]